MVTDDDVKQNKKDPRNYTRIYVVTWNVNSWWIYSCRGWIYSCRGSSSPLFWTKWWKGVGIGQGSTINHKITCVITCAKILVYVRYVGKYQRVYIRHHTFNLVIFLTIFPKLVLIYIERKIANSAKTSIDVSSKKIHALTVRIHFQIYTV